MCLLKTKVRGRRRWNWGGDEIVHDCSVPAKRPLPGRKGLSDYLIDVREFLVTEKNAIMRRTLSEDVRSFVTGLPGGRWDLFCSSDRGSFDHRANMIAHFVAQKIRYAYTPGDDAWQFPDETLYMKEGDCEDRALLIASLLIAAGVSAYNVRVVLGKVALHGARGKPTFRDHVWVMYKTEAGQWQVLEPLNAARSRAPGLKKVAKVEQAEYLPIYVFNDAHLWTVHGAFPSGKPPPQIRLEWSQLHPSFHGAVHQSIVDDALGESGAKAPTWVIDALNRHFSRVGFVGPIVEDIDRDMAHYDPRDHFDNGYIEDSVDANGVEIEGGWTRVALNLAQFKFNNAANLESFARAAHAIADFYAHSSYMHFAKTNGDDPVLYRPGMPLPSLRYDRPPFDLNRSDFTVNDHYWTAGKQAAIDAWNGKLLTGRYAQKHDARSGLLNLVIEGQTNIPSELESSDDFQNRRALPHHNEIAVDEDARSGEHVLYSDKSADPRLVYANQFRWRKKAATKHVQQAFEANWKP